MQQFLSKSSSRARFLITAFILLSGISGYIQARSLIKIDGSSTVFPITEAVSEDFQTAKKGATMVTAGISGTGGGFKKFCRGEIDIVNASRPILSSEMEQCRRNGVQYIEMPIAFDALTVAVNPRNNWIKSITIAELKKMWEPAAQEKILNWNQINPAWPDARIKLFGAGADSGTFDYFTEAVVGKAKSSRGDFTASEDDNVLVQGVASDLNALGFFGFAYYIENQKKLKAVAIDHGAGGVLPSMLTVQNGSYQPLSRPLFIYVNAKSANKPEIKEFVIFYMQHAQQLIEEVRYFPLKKEFYDFNIKHLQNKTLGTVFGGEAGMSMTIEELYKRERVQ
ncbi:phosphate ABC transporter substrate-binding protein, PhoT family [Nitrosomonas eutropha]|uniref:PstS family phosphate ABC transporter substrate-binding protein n=1 Tax=Nitrosomonas TaxID=914 RepID=UPI0008899542|nr:MULTISPECIES: PstS family phosphate ABC transporter substrate-binding protein [Nitrosomonas]MXS81275.1 PstS family phosphate ABC transporter substrate-binding protein [Nitrosomonas sp. GH22]SCX21755.1 phosphate ABC transporter substrate-binding protein, PhoT family [Nitrosomonas eutropha]SDW99325.1 phosphate ABC transporter substrate-binding protein, PhoT family [Nitrosomonas eutropha]